MSAERGPAEDELRFRGVPVTPIAAPGDRPVMRVSHIKANVDSFRELEGDDAQRVRQILGPALLGMIADAPKNAWMPVEVDIEMTEAVGQVCGESGVRRWSREALRRSIDGPLIGPIVAGAVQVFGLSPGRILGMIPRSIRQVYRGCGTWTTTGRTESELQLRWEDVPAVIGRSHMHLAGYAGAFEALLDVARVSGDIGFTSREESPARYVVELSCSWSL